MNTNTFIIILLRIITFMYYFMQFIYSINKMLSNDLDVYEKRKTALYFKPKKEFIYIHNIKISKGVQTSKYNTPHHFIVKIYLLPLELK